MRFRTPANILLRRAQLILIFVALVPTALATLAAIILLVLGEGSITIVTGVLVLAFCTSSLTGYILGSIVVSRGASLAKVQNDFLSSVSHELTTPITSVRMFIETLRDERLTDPEERQKCLAIIDREMARLDGLVSKLIDLSRLESGRQPFEVKAVAVKDVVEDALAALEVVTLGSEVDLKVDLQPDLQVLGDRASLAQALSNLLTNAWKYTPEDDRKITVTAGASGPKHVAIAVCDNGPGVPDDEQRIIFREFERGRAAHSSRIAGSGLGLAIVRLIVRAHKGRVELQSTAGQGACFRMLLPRPAE